MPDCTRDEGKPKTKKGQRGRGEVGRWNARTKTSSTRAQQRRTEEGGGGHAQRKSTKRAIGLVYININGTSQDSGGLRESDGEKKGIKKKSVVDIAAAAQRTRTQTQRHGVTETQRTLRQRKGGWVAARLRTRGSTALTFTFFLPFGLLNPTGPKKKPQERPPHLLRTAAVKNGSGKPCRTTQTRKSATRTTPTKPSAASPPIVPLPDTCD